MSTAIELLTVSGLDDAFISASKEARAERDTLLSVASGIVAITDAESAAHAANALKEMKTFTRAIEEARSSVKAPVLEIGKQIDGLAKQLTSKIDAESTRLSRIVGAWQAEQNRIAEEARRKAWEEEQRIKEEANRKIREAEESSRTQSSFEKKAEKIEAQATQAIVETRIAAANAAAPKPAGFSTREEICFEVTNITALYEAAPYLVTLTPNTAALKAALRGLTGGQTLPGVRHWKEQKTVVR